MIVPALLAQSCVGRKAVIRRPRPSPQGERLSGWFGAHRHAPSFATAATAAPEHLRWVRASAGDLTHQINVNEVLFFHADDKYTCVQTATAEYLIRTPISELAMQLDPALFVQVHRSTLVNMAHLAGTRRDEASRLFLRVKGHAHELPVSRAYVPLFKAM